MNEKDKILAKLQNLGVTTDVYGESLSEDSPSIDIPQNILEPELFTEEKPKEKKSQYKKGLDYAVRILSLRDYSIHKMKQKLKERGIEQIDSEKIIEQLLSWNYLREEEYTKQRIKQLILKGFANNLILQKLRQEHLTPLESDIDDIRCEQDLTSDSQLDYLIQKKLRGKDIPTEFEAKMKLKNKVTRFLISKGYQFSEINTALAGYI